MKPKGTLKALTPKHSGYKGTKDQTKRHSVQDLHRYPKNENNAWKGRTSPMELNEEQSIESTLCGSCIMTF